MKDKVKDIILLRIRALEDHAETLLLRLNTVTEDYEYYRHEYLVYRGQISCMYDLLSEIEKL